jgi:hypothetical protein
MMQKRDQRMRRLTAAGLLPDRAGQPVKALVHMTLAELRAMDGGSVLQAEWTLAAAVRWAARRAAASVTGSDGGAWLAGPPARAVACDAILVPVVTGDIDIGAPEGLVRLCVQLDRLDRHNQAPPPGEPGPDPQDGHPQDEPGSDPQDHHPSTAPSPDPRDEPGPAAPRGSEAFPLPGGLSREELREALCQAIIGKNHRFSTALTAIGLPAETNPGPLVNQPGYGLLKKLPIRSRHRSTLCAS